jgi:hypothetical protein
MATSVVASSSPYMMLMMMFPGAMNGMMQPPESSSEEEAPEPAVAKAPPSAPPEPVPAVPDAEKYLNDRFARSATFVRDVSVKELSMMVEKLEGSLDSSWTADLSKTGHLALIYICSRLKPGQKLTELSCLACSCKGCINLTFSHVNEQEALSRFVCLQ